MKDKTRSTAISLMVILGVLMFGFAQETTEPRADPRVDSDSQQTMLRITVEPEGLRDLLITIMSSEGKEVFSEEMTASGEITGIPAGEYVVSAVASGFAAEGQVVELEQGQQRDVNLTLEESDNHRDENANRDNLDNDTDNDRDESTDHRNESAQDTRATDSSSQQTMLRITVEPEDLRDLLITIMSSEGEEAFFGEVEDPEEIIEITDIPAGEYVVSATASGFTVDSQMVELEEGQPLEITLILEESDDTEGDVSNDNMDDGTYDAMDEPADAMDESVDDRDDDSAEGTRAADSDSQQTTLRITVEPEDLSDLLITVISSEGEEVFSEEMTASGELTNIPAGEYTVSAAASGFAAEGQVVELEEGQQRDITLTLEESDSREEDTHDDDMDNDRDDDSAEDSMATNPDSQQTVLRIMIEPEGLSDLFITVTSTGGEVAFFGEMTEPKEMIDIIDIPAGEYVVSVVAREFAADGKVVELVEGQINEVVLTLEEEAND